MADKKITALTELNATNKDSAVDLLHIIDFSASPVNKKISVANLFSNVNTDTHIYGASKTFEIGFANDTNSAFKVTTASANNGDGSVIINDDGNQYTDFTVKSLSSDGAIKVDAGTDDVTINSDSVAAVDFTVNGDNGVNIYADGGLDCVGIGTGTVDGSATLTVAADATTGHALRVQGNLLLSESAAVSAAGAIPLTKPVVLLTIAGSKAYTLADGVNGQIMTFVVVATSGSPAGTLTPATRNGYASVGLDAAGESVTLMFHGGKWNVLSTAGPGTGATLN